MLTSEFLMNEIDFENPDLGLKNELNDTPNSLSSSSSSNSFNFNSNTNSLSAASSPPSSTEQLFTHEPLDQESDLILPIQAFSPNSAPYYQSAYDFNDLNASTGNELSSINTIFNASSSQLVEPKLTEPKYQYLNTGYYGYDGDNHSYYQSYSSNHAKEPTDNYGGLNLLAATSFNSYSPSHMPNNLDLYQSYSNNQQYFNHHPQSTDLFANHMNHEHFYDNNQYEQATYNNPNISNHNSTTATTNNYTFNYLPFNSTNEPKLNMYDECDYLMPHQTFGKNSYQSMSEKNQYMYSLESNNSMADLDTDDEDEDTDDEFDESETSFKMDSYKSLFDNEPSCVGKKYQKKPTKSKLSKKQEQLANMPAGMSQSAKRKRKRILNRLQRAEATMREKRRMLKLNKAFEELRKVLPISELAKNKLSRAETLKSAIEYIEKMSELLTIWNIHVLRIIYLYL